MFNKIHELKIKPVYFEAVKEGTKTFELRRDDRNFKVGDILLLREWEHGYSGRKIKKKVIYILKEIEGLEAGYCILALGEVEN